MDGRTGVKQTIYAEWTLLPKIFGQVHFLYKWCLLSFYYYHVFIENSELNANSADPDQTPHSVASDLGLHCLPMSLLWDVRYNCVNARPPFFEWAVA